MSATEALQLLAMAVAKQNEAHKLSAEARELLSQVAQVFKVDAASVASNPLMPAPVPDSSNTLQVSLWLNSSGSALKASGAIDGSDLRVALFDSDKPGVLLAGPIEHKDAPRDNRERVGYCMLKQKNGKNELSIVINDVWFNGELVQNQDTNNPKAPQFRCTLVRSGGAVTATQPATQPAPVPTPVAPVVPPEYTDAEPVTNPQLAQVLGVTPQAPEQGNIDILTGASTPPAFDWMS